VTHLDQVPDAPTTVTVLADYDGHARWVTHLSGYDIMDAATTKGIYLLVTLDPEGSIQIATKPGNAWDSTWSPSVEVQRK
jgi:hypothetical protein